MSERNPASPMLIRQALTNRGVDVDYASIMGDKHAGRLTIGDDGVDESQFDAIIDEIVESVPAKFRQAEQPKAPAYDAAEEGRRQGEREKAAHADRQPGGLAFR